MPPTTAGCKRGGRRVDWTRRAARPVDPTSDTLRNHLGTACHARPASLARHLACGRVCSVTIDAGSGCNEPVPSPLVPPPSSPRSKEVASEVGPLHDCQRHTKPRVSVNSSSGLQVGNQRWARRDCRRPSHSGRANVMARLRCDDVSPPCICL